MQWTEGDLTDSQWERVRAVLPTRSGRGRPWRDHRQVIDGIRWVLRNDRTWRAMPERYGPWKTAFSRYTRWERSGLWDEIERVAAGEAPVTCQTDAVSEQHADG